MLNFQKRAATFILFKSSRIRSKDHVKPKQRIIFLPEYKNVTKEINDCQQSSYI